MKPRFRRTLSIVLSIAMLFSMTGMNTVFAAEGGTTIGASGLCEHHESHTEDCYTDELVCDIVVDSGEPAATEDNAAHKHTQDCYKLDCQFVCEECATGQTNPQPTPCALTEGCTLENGHEGDCVSQPAGALFAITKQPADQTAAEGEAVSFSLSASGEGLSYRWQTASMLEDNSAFTRADIADPAALTWRDVEGADEAGYAFDVTLADLYENFYRCVVADGAGQMLTSQIVTVSETENPLTKAGWGGGTLTPENHIFVPAAAGYGEQTAQVFTVTNDGFAAVDNLTATLGANSNFEITDPLSPTTLAQHAAATVSIRPKIGLAAGTYTDTLTVASTDGGTTKTASLSFTVHAASSSVNVATAAELKTALTATDDSKFTINVTESITLTEQGNIALGASHILNVASGKTVTIDGNTMIHVGAHSLTIKGASKENSTLVCNRTSGFALYGSSTNGTLRLDELTVDVIGGNGIDVGYTDIGSGARLVLNSSDKSNLVRCNQSLAVSGEIDIQAFWATAIVIDSGTMTIKNGGTVKVGEGSADNGNRGIEVYSTCVLDVESGGTLTGGAQAGGIALNSNSKVAGMAGKLVDRGQTLAANGQVTVAQSGAASATGLTAGTYVWNGAAFEKADIASIEVSADGQTENFSVTKGGTLQLTATVKDAAGAEVAEGLRGVKWALLAIPGVSYATGTNISGSGLLTVAADETAASISVHVYSIKTPAVRETSSVSVTDGGAVTVTTAAELKTALEKTTAQTINVTANIEGLGATITVGANHTLNIGSGKTVTTSGQYDNPLQIPNGKTLTLAGTGTLKANNHGSGSTGVELEGTLQLNAGSKLVAANSGEYSIGVSLGVSDVTGSTPGTLVSQGGSITLQNSGNNSTSIGGSTGSDTVTLYGGSLTVGNTAGYGLSVAQLDVIDGCAVTVENTSDANSCGIIADTVSVTDSTLRIANTAGTGLLAQALTVTGCSATVANTDGQGVDIDYYAQVGLFTLENSDLTLENTGGTGLAIGSGDELHIDNSTVNCAAGGGTGIAFNDGAQTQLIGANGGKLTLAAGAKLGSVGYRFSDRGSVYIYSGTVTVAAESGPPSNTVLTAGDYVWDDSSLFAKTAPAAVTGVSVSPATANVQKGTTRSFGATVTGTGAYSSAVTWSVTGGGAGTSIDTNGVLTVAAEEAATTLTVTATSTADTGKKGTATVTVTSSPVTKYLVTVNGGTGGAEYETGNTVTITATVPMGKIFKNWTVESGGVTLANANSASTTFTMPSNAVTVTASFEDAHTHSYTGPWQYSSAQHWQLCSCGEKGNVASHSGNPCSVCGYSYSTGGGGGSSSGGGSSPSTPTITPPDTTKPNTPTDAKTEVKATVDNTGKATATVPEKSVTDALKAAQDAAKKNGAEQNGISVTIDLNTDKAASSIAATLPANSINELVKAGVTELKIESGTGDIRLDLATLKAIQTAGSGNVTVGMTKADVSKLSAEAKKAIGNRPVFDLSVTAGGKAVTSFGGGQVSVGLPYTVAANENPGNLFGVYVDNSGKVTYLTNSSYDANAKMLYFGTDHFSTFGIGYKEMPAFTDVKDHWAEQDIRFVVARGLLSGTSNTTFAPNTGMTRGMFVTALGRLAGIDSTKYKNTKFSDVAADAYYAPYVAWAAEVGITSGTSATTFSPDITITRQELATLMVNYAKVMKYTLPKTREAVTFADAGSIGGFAKDAVKAMQMAGVMNGKDGNRFDPTGTATRAEVAATLHRYVELVIDPATAQGLDTNDSGSAMMYENGKAVKSASRTVNGNTYTFNTFGEAALPPTKKTGTYIVQKGDSFWRIAHKLNCTMAELEALNGKSRNDIIYEGQVLKVPQA